jgi:Xaa-Pro aminopeptidase
MKMDIAARRARIAKALSLAVDLKDEIILVGAGEPLGIPGGQDQTYPFLSHAEYFYLTDAECEGGVVAFDPKSGWQDFVPVVTQSQKVWEGREQVPGTPLPELAAWMAARRGRPVVMLGNALPGIKHDSKRTDEVREAFTHARRPKDAAEIARMKEAAAATAPAYARVRALLAEAAGGACVSERVLKAEIECQFGRHRADGPAYGTIVGVGSNGAVLHFDPTERAAKPGDLVLIDAGAQIDRYSADVTRTFACGPVDAARKELHASVLRAFERAITRCVVGAEWIDVHVGAALDMAEGLVQMGVLKGSASSAVESGAMGLFFPHGLGHLIGLGVRDATGKLPGRKPSSRPGVVTIRCDFPLEAGYTITVEPGCYFIGPLLNDAENRAKHKDAVNWPLVDTLLASGIGGVRIEDNIHITTSGPENLTAMIPTGL